MRRLMLGMLLAAGAVLPTLATAQMGDQDRPFEAGQHRGSPGGERTRDHGGRPDQPRGEQRPAPQAAQPAQPAAVQPRPQPVQAPQAQVQAPAQVRVDGRGDGGFRGGGGFRGDAGTRGDDGNRFGGGVRVQGDERARFGNGGPRRFDQGNQPPQQQQGYREPQGGPGQGNYRPQGNSYRADAYGRGPAPQYRQAPGAPGQSRGGNGWSRGWRDDRRYDWGGYRAQNRSAFHLPRYYAPRGWGYGYRRFSPGFTLSAVLFDQGFWIDDPFYYRLPPAYGPYRWVRYYNDALLVDVRSGYVVDTVYDIFW